MNENELEKNNRNCCRCCNRCLVVFKLKSNKEITQSKVYQYDKEQAINVQADTLQIENVNAEFSYSGTFEPNKETKISAELQGKINEVLVDVGSVVNKGQSLVLLDNSLLKLATANY
jgi:membrane fusion protein (multidrug efflux system)